MLIHAQTMTPCDLDPDAIRQELDRLLASPGFVRNARMSQFLRFLVERHLEGQRRRAQGIGDCRRGLQPAARLRPQTGFDRSDRGGTSPSATCRVLQRLRGVRMRSRIDLPKGGYIPACRLCEVRHAVPAEAGPTATAAAHVAALACGERWPAPRSSWLTAGWWTLLRSRRPIAIAVLPLQNLAAGFVR